MIRFRIAALAAVALSLSAATVPAGAADSMGAMDHARFSPAAVYGGAPNLPLTLSLIAAGGGPSNFQTTKLVGTLAGPLTAAELQSLTAKFGADNVTSFVDVFNFVIGDALKIVTNAKIALPAQPAVDPTDGKALSAALYTAGVSNGKFDVEYMLDNLVSHPIHVQIMNDIDAKYGGKADGNYHAVLTQAMTDLKAAYKL
jgi:hypothetical protein